MISAQAKNRVKLLQLTSVSTLLALTGLAFSASANAADDNNVVSLEEVTISAGKLNLAEEEYIGNSSKLSTGLDLTTEETPQSISIITTKQMDDQQITTVDEAMIQSTGLTYKEYDSTRKYFFSRGFEIDNISVDGTQTMYDSGWGTGEATVSAIIYDQVEVTKGASGLSSGTGNPGASINLSKKRADSSELKGTVSVTAGTDDKAIGSLDIQGPLNKSKSVRGRLIVEHSQEDLFFDQADTEQQTAYATLEADLSEKTTFSIGYNHNVIENNGATWGGLTVFYDDGTRTNWDRSKTPAADWTSWNTTHSNFTTDITHKLNDNWTATAKFNKGTSDGGSELLYLYGYTNKETGLGLTGYGGKYDLDAEYQNTEVSVAGKFKALGRTHEANVGISQAKRSFMADSYVLTDASFDANFNEYDGTGYDKFEVGAKYAYEHFTETHTSAFASTRLNVSDKLKVISGARITNFERDYDALAGVENSQNLDYNNEAIPYFGLLYDLNNKVTAYASYTDIFTPQNEVNKDGENLDPIFGNSLEIGLKTTFLDDRIRGHVALFNIEQDNLATEDGSETVLDTLNQAYVEADGATSKGFEVELSGAIREGWNFQVGLSQYDITDASGEEIVTTQPRKTLKAFTSFKLPNTLSKWTLGAGVTWESESYSYASNAVTGEDERVEQEAYTLINLMAKYDINSRSTLQLNIENATDETYFTNIGTFGQYSYGNPRAATLNYKYAF